MHKTKTRFLIAFGLILLFVFSVKYFLSDKQNSRIENNKIISEIFNTEKGFGYKIYIDDNLYIEQPVIPGLPGNRSFETLEDATKVANLAIEKINNGFLPPTTTIEELDSMGIK